MKDWIKEIATWTTYLQHNDSDLLAQLNSCDDKEKMEAFAGEMVFGTGGLRAVLGVGPARMNVYTVARATQGLARAILNCDASKSVAIAYDTRKNSELFAKTAARVLAGNGIEVVLFAVPSPTPVLSYAVRKLHLGWGIVITASHNPKAYNGYKVYDKRGVQLIPSQAQVVMDEIAQVDFFTAPMPELTSLQESGLVSLADGVLESYLSELYAQLPDNALCARHACDLPIVYSGLHGAGAQPVSQILARMGFSQLELVQMNADSDFGGVHMPNPEDPAVYAVALESAHRSGAQILLATDPDCDRVGVQVLHEGHFMPLSGNQIGALLVDYLLEVVGAQCGDTLVTTIVSGQMAQCIAKACGIEVMTVLTGFKFIGDVAENLSAVGKSFFFGYEESYGYLAYDLARDKDAVLAVALIAQMAVRRMQDGQTLVDRYQELCALHGYHLEKTLSRSVQGLDFLDQIARIMQKFRDPALHTLGEKSINSIEDYLSSERVTLATGERAPLNMPGADVVKLFLNASTLAVRPSGTEPNIKCYLTACGETLDDAQKEIDCIERALQVML